MTERSRPRLRAADKLARLKKACDLGRVDYEVVRQKLSRGEYQFHESGDALALTHIGVSGRFKTLYVDVIAGDILDVPALGTVLEEFGRKVGCQVLEADGRPGWEQLFRKMGKDRGYRKVAIKYRKDL